MEAFYSDTHDKAFRLGDILHGIALATLQTPNLPISDFTIDVKTSLVAVLSPCCSIDNQTICLCPLIHLTPKYFDNPYYVEDFTRINREMEPNQAFSPTAWSNLPTEEQNKKIGHGRGYACIDYFVYSKHDLLPSYKIRKNNVETETNYYQVDFRQVTRVTCSQIQRNNLSPLGAKSLQLSIEARNELREKILAFYKRVPDEDQIIMA